MFTGLIETKGRVITNQNNGLANHLIVSTPWQNLDVGESIAVNGVCLTLLPSESTHLAHFDLSPETLKLTTLSSLTSGEFVNLERALLTSTRLGGHYVTGHVDTTVRVKTVQILGDYVYLEIGEFAHQERLYLIPKGSITVDGVSLTINAVEANTIQLMLVPHTLAETTLSNLRAGDRVNIEFDYFTRIVAHQLQLMGKLECEVNA